MSKRIKEIANKCGVVYDLGSVTGGPEVYFDRQEQFEKFAELIVKECIYIDLRQAGLSWEQWDEVSKVIGKHFGI